MGEGPAGRAGRSRRGRLRAEPSLAVCAGLLVLFALGALAGASPAPSPAPARPSAAAEAHLSKAPPSPDHVIPDVPLQQVGASDGAAPASCDYTVSLQGTAPVARSASGASVGSPSGTDVGALLDGIIAPHETICVGPGEYSVSSEIKVQGTAGVTLSLDEGAYMNASGGYRSFVRPYFRASMLLVNDSPGTVVSGGHWIGPGGGDAPLIRIQTGSDHSAVEGTDVSGAGWDGILIYDDTGPSLNVTISHNLLHDNGRYGVQEYANETTPYTGTVISGNRVLDNHAGGIYTNRATGDTIAQNVVENTVGNGPGKIGIGVTDGANDTVAANLVERMAWFGIQAFYNNHTMISDNVSILNAGGLDQSGITNDHSSFDRITGNVVDGNGRYGIYVERSWNVTVSGNTADGNGGYGIELNHGSAPSMGFSTVSGNSCSSNALGGIILNSAIDNVVSMNVCTDNNGTGILLYNDQGQAGSTGNLLVGNLLGNVGNSTSQAFGVKEENGSWGNTLLSNAMASNSVAGASLVG